MRDFLELDYKEVNLDVKLAPERGGEVYGFLKRSKSDNDVKRYGSLVKYGIERQKYLDSQKAGFDVGLTVATANFMEGKLSKFILRRLRKEGIKLDKCERALRIYENGDTYHIIPATDEDLLSLKLGEQRGISACSILKQISKEPNVDIRSLKNQWVSADNYRNCNLFREILSKEDVKIKEIFGSRTYTKCYIYKNLNQKVIDQFQLDVEEVRKANPLELAITCG